MNSTVKFFQIGVCCLLLTVKVFGQPPNAFKLEPMPPSPQAADLGKYGEIPVGYQTGVPNISIPIYTLRLNDFNLPISLTYYSMGNKVDELASNVGLGWTLQATGTISSELKVPSELPEDNWLIAAPPAAGAFEACDYIFGGAGIEYDQAKMWTENSANFEGSLFNFNFAGLSGKFFFRPSYLNGIGIVEEAAIIPAQSLRIFRKPDNTIFALDENGVRYSFDTTESSMMLTTCLLGNPNIVFPSSNTSYFLTKITTPNGNEITFYYEPENYNYKHSKRQTISGIPTTNAGGCGTSATMTGNECTNRMTVSGQRLIRIEGSDGQKVIFHDNDRADLYGTKKIDEIKIENNGIEVKKFVLYNNSYFGGSYTGVEEQDEINLKLRLDSIKEFSGGNSLPPYKFVYNNTSPTPRVNGGRDYFGYSIGGSSTQPTSMIPGQPDINFSGVNRDPNMNVFAGILLSITYPTTGRTEFDYELDRSGGLRIKYIKNYTDATTIAGIKRYRYDPATNPSPVTGSHDYTGNFGAYRSMYEYFASPVESDSPPCTTQTTCYAWSLSSDVQSFDFFEHQRSYAFVEEITESASGLPSGKTSYHYGPDFTYSPSSILYDIAVNSNYGKYVPDGQFLVDPLQKTIQWKLVDPVAMTWLPVHETKHDYFAPGISEYEFKNFRIVQDRQEVNIACGVGGYCSPAVFSVYRYRYISSWIRISKTTETNYDNNGSAALIKTTDFLDYDLISKKPIHIRTTQSNGKITDSYLSYPSGFSGNAIYDGMVSRNMVSPVVTQREVVNNLLSSEIVTAFGEVNSTYKPTAIYSFDGSTTRDLNTIGTLSDPANPNPAFYYANALDIQYDALGNITHLKRNDGISVKFKWGYNNQYFVAKKEGSNSLDFFFTSFEEDGELGVDMPQPMKAQTGAKAFNGGSYSIPFQPGDPSTYKMSYWYYQNNKWNFSGEIDFESPINSSATYIDEVRVYPKGSRITSYTFDFKNGATTVTDHNNLSRYFDYDALTRLSFVSDHERNLLSYYLYNFKK